jgi:uncharacterized protein
MIINAHVHLIEIAAMARKFAASSLPRDVAVFKEVEASLPLLAPERLLEQMDEAGVDRSILFAVDAPIVYSSNEYVHELCSRHPDRFIGFASVNPNNRGAAKALERAVVKLGLCGLKLHPPLQNFAPDDRIAWPIYEKAVELNIPVVFHVGTTPFGSLCRLAQANPILVDEVAVRFPDLRIMLTHLGTMWDNEAFMVAEKNPNVFIDTAAYLPEIRTLLTPQLVERVGPEKFIFGTDYPMPYAGRTHRIKDFVTCIKRQGLAAGVLRGIFQDNVQALLAGRKAPAGGMTMTEMFEKAARPAATTRRSKRR